jgi:hypothetical protein
MGRMATCSGDRQGRDDYSGVNRQLVRRILSRAIDPTDFRRRPEDFLA